MKHRLTLPLIITAVLLLLTRESLAVRTMAAPLTQAPQPTPTLSPEGTVVAQAVQDAAAARQNLPAFSLNKIAVNHIDFTADGLFALVSLDALDPKTSQPIATEPGLAVAHLTAGTPASSTPAGWQITFQADSGWQAAFSSLPDSLKPQEFQMSALASQALAASGIKTLSTSGITLGGYLLPWAGGQAKTLTWSVSHASCYAEDCRYALDWWDGTHFPLLAAKGGTVFAAVWNWPNDDHTVSHTNYLVLKDTSTTPVSYQIYYHMEQNSIPDALRIPGAPVSQGQFIGRVDNTGASSGPHLHFMVHTNPYGLWGQSVDITFRDVKVNWDPATAGGRPRKCSETISLPQYGTQCQPDDKYVSGNYGSNPPDGGLTLPIDQALVTTPTVHVEGFGRDDLGISKLQVEAKWGGGFTDIGAAQTKTPFAQDIDLCAAGVPDGPVTLALRVWDTEGNEATGTLGTRTILKQARCPASPPPPPCTPGAEQVALYSEPNFGGSCQLFGAGSYADASTLGSLGARQAASIQVGSNASATLYQGASFQGRSETFIASDRNLADNEIGSGTASSLTVQKYGAATQAPVLNIPANLTSDDSVILAWQDAGGAYDFMPDLYTSSGTSVNTRIFDHVYYWSLDSLPAGSYTLKVCVSGALISDPNNYYHCDSGSTAGWTTARANFTVAQASGTPAKLSTQPSYAFDFNSDAGGWTAGTGWSYGAYGSGSTNGFAFNPTGAACTDGQRCRGSLTSPGMQLPASGDSYLHFSYRFTGTENPAVADLRRVQISKSDDGVTYGPFRDLTALGNRIQDTPGAWLPSPDGIRINCSTDHPDYCGKYVRIRFYFDSVDGLQNSGASWSIDDVRIDQVVPPDMSKPAALALNTPTVGAVNPSGDADQYTFTAAAGQVYQADVAASGFTPILEAIDSDGTSLLASGQPVGTITRLSFRAPAAKTYTLRVRTNPFPGGAASNLYVIKLTNPSSGSNPTAAFGSAFSGGYLNAAPLSVSASEAGGGISRVDYYYHVPDGLAWRWWKAGTSWDPSNGWAISPAAIPEGAGIAVWARVYDWALNYTDIVQWNLMVDRTPPVDRLNPLPATVPNTAVQLSWSAVDAVSGVDHIQVQVEDLNGGTWQDLPTPGSGSTWFVGDYGHTYGFRMRSFDRAGNATAFPDAPETTVQMVDPGSAGQDSYEATDTPAAAPPLTVDGGSLSRSFYIPGSQPDTDWVSFPAVAGQRYILWVQPTAGSPAQAQVSLYPGLQALQSGPAVTTQTAAQLGQPVMVFWTAPATGQALVMLNQAVSSPPVEGSGVGYTVWVGTKLKTFLPTISR